MKFLGYILLLAIFWSCDKSDFDFEIELPFEGDGTQIEIYLVKTEKLENFNHTEELYFEDLEETSWLAHDQIEFYDWSSHTFYLKEEHTSGKGGNYFVLTADKEPIFTGFFHSSPMSTIPPVPIITTDYNFGSPKDVITLNRFGCIDTDGIMANDSRFRREMENSGLLKEGIDLDLLSLKRRSTSTLEYTYKITNNDLENIYLFDPAKMGASRFHYFTNGVSMRKGDTNYNSSNLESTASDKILSNWYFKLDPGKSLTRTVTLNGFESLPTGVVKARFNFPGAHYLNEKEWKKSDGRVWIGSLWIEKEIDLD
jgi:hypothetical protein